MDVYEIRELEWKKHPRGHYTAFGEWYEYVVHDNRWYSHIRIWKSHSCKSFEDGKNKAQAHYNKLLRPVLKEHTCGESCAE